jgi:hypothetical protein
MVSKMHKVIAILCVISLMTPCLPAADVDLTACLSLNWVACGVSVGSGLYNKYYGKWLDSQDDVSAFGTACKTQFRGSFYQWKWVWGGQFWCPSISETVQGQSENYASRDGAIEHALQDYVTKAGQAGLLTQQQISQYSTGKSKRRFNYFAFP